VEVYLHSPIRLHGVVLYLISSLNRRFKASSVNIVQLQKQYRCRSLLHGRDIAIVSSGPAARPSHGRCAAVPSGTPSRFP
jgi:hypothetical protein